MPDFTCRLATLSGEIIERSYTSSDEASLRRELEAKEYLVLELQRSNPILQQILSLFALRPRVSQKEFLFFNQELSALLRAGLPVLQSLDILLERRENPTFKRALTDIRERVKSGESLSEAFAAQRDLFPPLYAASLASGERSGELATVLKRFIAYSQNIMAVRRKVVSAMIYPLILVALSFGLVGLMVFYIIPKFNVFLEEFEVELPMLTVALVKTALFCTEHWKPILGGLFVVVVVFLAWRKSRAGKLVMDRLKLRIPLVGGIMHDYAQNRFTRTLATLQAGGIPLVNSLEIAAKAVGNTLFEKELFGVAGRVREGQALWESLEETRLISDIAVEMIKVGESTGALVDMLNDVSDFVDEEIDHKLQRIVSLMEPIMLVVMAVVVGGMLLAVYLPLIQAYGQARA
jgi:type IV pilus assembly protein PilC